MIERLELRLGLNFERGTLEGMAKLKLAGKAGTFLLNRGLSVNSASAPFSQRVEGFNGLEAYEASVVRLELPLEEVELTYSGRLESYESVLPYLKDSINPEYTLLRTDSLFYPIPSEPDFESLIKSVVGSEFDAEITVEGIPEGLVVAFGGEIKENRLRIEGTKRLDIAVAPFKVIEKEPFRLFILSEEGIERTLDLLGKAHEFYSTILGSRVEKFTVIETPENYGGQAGKGYALVSGSSLRAEIPANLYHELAHLWNPRATPEAHQSRFFDEAFANYLTALAIREIHGEEAFNRFIEGLRRNYKAVVKRFPEAEKLKPSEWGELGLWELSYTKGALILYDLHLLMEDSFYDLLRILAGAENVDFERFKKLAEELSGRDLGDFFERYF
ncbi:gluzincin family metallopeptidase [Thermococcus gammatolerans]|uniref:Zinc-dependent metallopeptidase, putative n=1 Tax=Thermococcus gammatolerans (strain DSM 15229 / JCM 11827 / EJ3) TaxID=593117 RepID=C5A777_THEGJ|nr:peptidase [Thermococcus gammatolerans]ACS34089.1 Zinc-dependent metallopeptidase, putative [Thermococcus gammatolerans EJ3]